jgi:hypothetical protein
MSLKLKTNASKGEIQKPPNQSLNTTKFSLQYKIRLVGLEPMDLQ